MMNLKDEIEVLVEEDSKIFEEVSDKIWEYAEMIYEEKQSCELQKQVMRDLGFTVNDQLPGLPTAFIASYGEGKPVIAILGEYDALANLSQEADCLEHKPIEAGKPGHGCGHNLLGAASMSAVYAVKKYMDAHGIQGTIQPAAEDAGLLAQVHRQLRHHDIHKPEDLHGQSSFRRVMPT